MRASWLLPVAAGVALCAGCTADSSAVQSLDAPTGRGYCAQQQAADGGVIFGMSMLENVGSSEATLHDFRLIEPTQGIELEGVYLAPVSEAPANGQPFQMPDDPMLAIAPRETVFVVVGIGLDEGVHAARAGGVEFAFDEGGKQGSARTSVEMMTSEEGAPCDDGESSAS